MTTTAALGRLLSLAAHRQALAGFSPVLFELPEFGRAHAAVFAEHSVQVAEIRGHGRKRSIEKGFVPAEEIIFPNPAQLARYLIEEQEHPLMKQIMNDNNRVPSALPDAIFIRSLELVSELNNLLDPYLRGLSPAERMTLPKINVDNRDFVGDAIRQMKQPSAQQFLPAYLRPEEAERDLLMFDQAEALSAHLATLASKIDATRILAGSEAFVTCLGFKKMADAAESAGIPGASAIATALRERFRVHGARNPAATETTPGQ